MRRKPGNVPGEVLRALKNGHTAFKAKDKKGLIAPLFLCVFLLVLGIFL